jgi:predicted naringenin-chalcone synthase
VITAIQSLATALPRHAVSQSVAAQAISALTMPDADRAQSRMSRTIFRRTRIQSRHSVLLESGDDDPTQSFYARAQAADDGGPTTAQRMGRYVELALPLAARASRGALERAGVEPAQIDQVVAVTCTGFYSPGIDIGLINSLGLPPGVGRTIIGFMGCHGAFNGLRVASALTASSHAGARRVLLCAVELCSLHFAYGWGVGKVTANALFADGAAAAVVGPVDNGHADALRLRASGSTIVPDTGHAMTWRIGDHGFEMTLSPDVPDIIRANVRPWLEGWLREQGLTIGDVGSWAVHPGGPRILEAAAEAIGIGDEALADSAAVLRDCGNMSSPTILFILERLLARGAARPIVALGFGPGLAVEAMVFV